MSYEYQMKTNPNFQYHNYKYGSSVGKYSYEQHKNDAIIENTPEFRRSRQFLSKSNYTPYENLKRIPSSLNNLRQTYDPSALANKTNQIRFNVQSSQQKSPNNYLRNTINYPISSSPNPYCSTQALLKSTVGYGKQYEENKNYGSYKWNDMNKKPNNVDSNKYPVGLDYATLKQKLLDNARLINQLKAIKQERKEKNQVKAKAIYEVQSKKLSNPQLYTSYALSKSPYKPTDYKSWHQIEKPKTEKYNPSYKTTKQLPVNEKKLQQNNNNFGFYVNNFRLTKKLGGGKFGTVYFAKHVPTGAIFAVKQVAKSMIKQNSLEDQFLLQIKLQSYLNHGNIVKIYGVFDDKEHIYLILQYMEDGTLFTYMKKNQKLSEMETAIKVREISEAINFIHDEGIAHRDIKPENIVMTHNVCKLCDFGWATVCDERRKTYCGTFDYAAPQILQGIEYDMTVDLWCLGVLAYQLMVGKAPFYHISRKETMKKILNVQKQTIIYPNTMSNKAISFIKNLVKKDPQQRMKSQDLLSHPFLRQAITQFQ